MSAAAVAEATQVAQDHHATARRAYDKAARAARLARQAAAHLDDAWRAPGGADAATVLRFIAQDTDGVRAALLVANKAAHTARTATSVHTVHEATERAATAAASAEWDTETVVRLARYLIDAA